MRPIRIANCSGAIPDPGYQMYRQGLYGPVDAITGDYLAEMNLGSNAKAYREGRHAGWEPSAEEGLMQTLDLASEKKFKIVVNGGALNPKGLAEKVAKTAQEKELDLQVSYVSGDDVFDTVGRFLDKDYPLKHLDHSNENVKVDKMVEELLTDSSREVVSANGYLGGRGIRAALEAGADIIICGRVADASPVIGLAAWWHKWSETNFDQMAGALVAGHLIECSAYATGGNFSDFERYNEDLLIDVGLPIAEIASDGAFVITKHEALNGIVNVDVCKCQLLYELQGNIYLNNDVKADLKQIQLEQVGENRVSFKGIKGYPPPPTTKLAIFWVGGYQSELTFNATGTPRNVRAKFNLFERQILKGIEDLGLKDKFDILDFQKYAEPEINPVSQRQGTSYIRIFAQAKEKTTILGLLKGMRNYFMQHYSGFHSTMDFRTGMPLEYVAYFPAVVSQSEFKEKAHLIDNQGNETKCIDIPLISKTEPLQPRQNYDTTAPEDLASFGPEITAPIETAVLGRSGDKGGNVNLGLFVHEDDEFEWLKAYFTRSRLQALIGNDWKDDYYIERVEFPNIRAVHFVVYGILGRGTSSSPLLDSLGKGFCDYIRSKHVKIPKRFVDRYNGKSY